jgi:hypothetical protein
VDVNLYKAKINRFENNNVLRADIYVLGIVIRNKKMKLAKLTTKSLRSQDKFVQEAARLCWKEITKYITMGETYIMRIYGKDPYTCEIYPERLEGKSLNDHLIENGFALYQKKFVKNLVDNL